MSDLKFFESYNGETTDELLSLEPEFRTDSIVMAFEAAIQLRAEQRRISAEERIVLAVEGLEREVNNGGYAQFFTNSSKEFVDVIVDALLAIGCPAAADITRQAIKGLNIAGESSAEKAEAAVLSNDEAILRLLEDCDARFAANSEAIGNQLFSWIKSNRRRIKAAEDE